MIAEHDCIESLPIGHEIQLTHEFPSEWWILGDKSIKDPKFHSELRETYFGIDSVDSKEGSLICLFYEDVYLTISDNRFGPWFGFSTVLPKCWKCMGEASISDKYNSISGLKIGQTKQEVAQILDIPLDQYDVFNVIYHEIEKGVDGDIWHDETMRLEFELGILIRFSIYDYREKS